MAEKYQLPVRGTTTDGLAVTISEVELGNLTQLAGWESFDKLADDVLRKQALSLPGDCRSSFRRGLTTVWRVAPDRVLVRSDTALSFGAVEPLVALELSDSRVCLRLNGPGASSLLSRVVALDLSDTGFPVGTFAQTAIHHVSVLVDRIGGDEFDILIPTTFGVSLSGFLGEHLKAAA
ncbi:sarcosine oxidase subunit gamma [Mesorhizobium carmichaelinearum]|uniref:sarcosine oxidase subunit gamma n=1 Tax=Mesorhizobium carmichaelinearum TaxID=1208188 RepID=UPI0015CB90A2|nr:hypothetical protein [Mesorhizobium carmichaelinearum]